MMSSLTINDTFRLAIISFCAVIIISFIVIRSEITAQQITTVTNESTSSVKNIKDIHLGDPLFVESYKLVSSDTVQINGTQGSRSSFLGSGTIGNMSVTATGSALVLPRSGGNIALNGSALLTSNGGEASYTFEAIGYPDDGKSRSRGATFFDGNATGDLEFLNNVVGIYRTEAVGDQNGTFVMWEWK